MMASGDRNIRRLVSGDPRTGRQTTDRDRVLQGTMS